MHYLNRGLSRGAMSVVIPVSAVTGVALSVVCGALFLGTAPRLWHGWASVSPCPPCGWSPPAAPVPGAGGRTRSAPLPADGPLAGLEVAVQYIGLAQADPASGL